MVFKTKGIHYSYPGMGWISKNDNEIKRDMMEIINCGFNAIKLNGYDKKVLNIAKIAKDNNLKVFLHPQFIEIWDQEVLDMRNYTKLLVKTAKECEKLGVDVLGVGNELSVEIKDLYSSKRRYREIVKDFNTVHEGIKSNPETFKRWVSSLSNLGREHFSGDITYFSGPWEWDKVDWDYFDIVSCNVFYNEQSKHWYKDIINGLKSVKGNDRFIVGEMGYATVKNAFEVGIDWIRIEEEKVEYSEETQSKLLFKNLKILQEMKVAGFFIHTWEEHINESFGLKRVDGRSKDALNMISRLMKNEPS